MLKKKRFVFSNLLSRAIIIFIELACVVYVSHFKNVTLFLVREHSERRCFLVFAVHCGIFQGANVQVHWKDFAIETALKMADSLIGVLTTEQGSWLRRTLNLFSFETAYSGETESSSVFYSAAPIAASFFVQHEFFVQHDERFSKPKDNFFYLQQGFGKGIQE